MDHREIEKFEQQQVGKLKLSEAIRIGAMTYKESRAFFFRGSYCAVCGAIKVLGGSPEEILRKGDDGTELFRWLQGRTGAPVSIIAEVSQRHYRGASREAVADWLESQGL